MGGDVINMKAEKMAIVFPHLPNPRMMKRINALHNEFDIEVIYWDRKTGIDKTNRISEFVQTTVISEKANEGNPMRRMTATLKVLISIINRLKIIEVDYLYVSKTDMLLIALLYKLFYVKKVKIVYEVSDLHALLVDELDSYIMKIISKLLKTMERKLSSKADMLIVTSESFYTYFYKNYVQQDRVLFIPNAPEPNVFADFCREKHSLFTIGFIGAIRYAEQIELLIDAAELSNVHVLIAGGGIDLNRIKEYAKGKPFVTIYGPYEYKKEIKSLYEQVDCVYAVYNASMKNVQIALPNRLYEAVYTHTPIIAAKNTYLGTIVERERIGLTVNHKSVNELVSLINKLVNDKNIVSEMKERSNKLIKEWDLECYNRELLKRIRGLREM